MPLLSAYVMPHPPLAIPDIGRGSEAKIPQTMESYLRIGEEIALLAPDTIVIVSPHAITNVQTFLIAGGETEEMSLETFGAPHSAIEPLPILTIDHDQELARQIKDKTAAIHVPVVISEGKRRVAGERVDHGSFVPLYFVAQAEMELAGRTFTRELHLNTKVVRLSFSGLSKQTHFEYGMAISDAIQASGKRIVFIASGDLSHRLKKNGPYGLAPRSSAFDKDVISSLAAGDFLRLLTFEDDLLEEVAECGLRSLNILGGVLEGADFEPELLSYENTFGVGYAQAAFRNVIRPSPSRGERNKAAISKSAKQIPWLSDQDPYAALAHFAVETYISSGRKPVLSAEELSALPQEMTSEKAGTFVSLHRQGKLRGCIGTIQPRAENIAEEIILNAIAASTADLRFEPVKEDELDSLEYGVDVLTHPESIESIDELDVKRYGVIVSRGRRRGLLLPDLDGVDTAQDQVAIARQKAGIGPDEPVTLERFKVIRHK